MNVVYSASRNLYPYMLPSIMSLLEHNEVENIFLLIEDDALPYPIPEQCTCINVSGQTIFPETGANYRSQFTYMALMRAAYTLVLPPEIDKVIQLDIDTIVTDSLLDLWETDMTGKWMAACNEERGIFKPFGNKYYNIGVALFNLSQIRQDGVDLAVIEALNTQPLRFLEQDAWNWFGQHAGKIIEVPTRFNECFATGFSVRPAVIHYAGFPDWMHNQNIPMRQYLDRYKHLYKENLAE